MGPSSGLFSKEAQKRRQKKESEGSKDTSAPPTKATEEPPAALTRQVAKFLDQESQVDPCLSDTDSEEDTDDGCDMEDVDSLVFAQYFADEVDALVEECSNAAGFLDPVAFARAVLDAADLDVPFAKSSPPPNPGTL